MFSLFLTILNLAFLALVMALGGILAIYGVTVRFVMGLEAHPSTIARFGWLCWGAAIFGVALFLYGGSHIARILMG